MPQPLIAWRLCSELSQPDIFNEIAFDAKTALEDCSDGWDKIYAVIDNHSAQLLDEKTTKEEE